VDDLVIEVPQMSPEKLREDAIVAYFGFGKTGFRSDDEDFLCRITVNYVRHQMTNYEDSLRKIAGKVGTKEAYLHLKSKVLDAIAEAYPELAAECVRQEIDLYESSFEAC
jgi:hypothetical protein